MNVYVLDYGGKIKIGKADNVLQRVKSLISSHGIPKKGSYSFHVGSNVFKIEKGLHRLMCEYSIDGVKGDGRSEFFSNKCWDEIKAIVSIKKFTVDSIDVDKLKPVLIDRVRPIHRFRDMVLKGLLSGYTVIRSSPCSIDIHGIDLRNIKYVKYTKMIDWVFEHFSHHNKITLEYVDDILHIRCSILEGEVDDDFSEYRDAISKCFETLIRKQH